MIRVLVVDDDFMVAKVHAAFVARTPGFEVAGVAHTGADGPRSPSPRCSPTSCCSTSTCPTCPGIEVLRRLRERQPDVDVLVISAAKEAETVRTALRGGVVNYLLKPFDQDALRDRLQRYAADAPLARRRRPSPRPTSTGCSAPRRGARRRAAAEGAEPGVGRPRRGRAAHGADDDLSASECADRTGLSRVSARRYLEYFVEVGRAEVRLQYGAAGRPQRRYAWKRPLSYASRCSRSADPGVLLRQERAERVAGQVGVGHGHPGQRRLPLRRAVQRVDERRQRLPVRRADPRRGDEAAPVGELQVHPALAQRGRVDARHPPRRGDGQHPQLPGLDLLAELARAGDGERGPAAEERREEVAAAVERAVVDRPRVHADGLGQQVGREVVGAARARPARHRQPGGRPATPPPARPGPGTATRRARRPLRRPPPAGRSAWCRPPSPASGACAWPRSARAPSA